MFHEEQHRTGFWRRHGLGTVALAILALWIVLYCVGDPSTHWGSFFGNAVADWTGVVVTVWGTKYLYEIGSSESRKPRAKTYGRLRLWAYDHSLTIFLVITGVVWVVLFAHTDTEGKWGQVVGNIVSEWTQIFGLVVLTKRLMESHSKESEEKD